VINIGFGQGITIGELAQKIFNLMGKTVPIVMTDSRIRPTRSEVQKLICDNRKAQQLLGWQPNYTLDAGLRATIDFIEKNLSLYKTDSYVV
ncbi:NAD-dependent dehydratase, partial [candidate division KSB1 bacterium]|nr:NAD-dependent dehydratase [candidate division KSB1 bacterium]